jgi:hypothetical protein
VWWCGGGGGGGGVGLLPIIIPHQPSCFVLFCVVGWVVAIELLNNGIFVFPYHFFWDTL